jgi:hypothetical protein
VEVPTSTHHPCGCQYINLSIKKSRRSSVNNLVKRSTRFVSESSLAIRAVPLATASLLKWYPILWCFFLIADSGFDQFMVTASLSQMSAGPINGTPNIRHLYLKILFSSIQFSAQQSQTQKYLTQLCSAVCCAKSLSIHKLINQEVPPLLGQ